MKPTSRKVAPWVCWGILGTLVAGCQMTESSVPDVQRPSVKIDPCAELLHDVCGLLLMYHNTHKRLPETLDELKAIDVALTLPLTCPLSGEPYIYNSHGLRIPAYPGRLVLYDAQAIHSGMRWGILVGNANSTGPLTARVVLLPEQAISAATGQGDPQADHQD